MEEKDDGSTHKRKPWGETFHFCPVALKDIGVLWPGSQDTALRLVLNTIICFNYRLVTMHLTSGTATASITLVVKKPKRSLQLIHYAMWTPSRYI